MQRVLDGNFVGAYLQGSFADGDFDEDSDVDFLIIVAHEIADDVLPALQARHAVVTREKAIVLTGPDPRDLIDEVSADALREEVCLLSRFAAHRFADPSNLQPRWVQAFFVVVYCRMLHTLAIGTGDVQAGGNGMGRGDTWTCIGIR